MYKILVLLISVAALAVASSDGGNPFGVVDPVTRCGGVGTLVQLRIASCEGRCALPGGSRTDIEKDFIISTEATSLTIRVEVCYHGLCWTVLETELASGIISPGPVYTARYFVIPNGIFRGEPIGIKSTMYHTNTQLVEVCLNFEVDII